MKILLHDYNDLEEKASKNLKVWKGWHITLYAFAAIFGILNYSFFQSTVQLFDNNCVLFPRQLEFRILKLSNITDDAHVIDSNNNTRPHYFAEKVRNYETGDSTIISESKTLSNETTGTIKTKREASNVPENDLVIKNFTIVNNFTAGNRSHRLVLKTSRTLFGRDGDCQFPMYMPILSAVFALVWATLFTICPGGGLSRSGLRQPWRILTPALLFAIILVGLTAYSFSQTNRGLQAFCSAFTSITNTTACSAINAHVESAWNVTWGIGARVAATRAASAGAWASWACACALLLARCLAAPDFSLRRTHVLLTHDPQQKITPYLKGSLKKNNSQSKPQPTILEEDTSVKSEPTLTSELVTASIEQRGLESSPTSLTTSPDHGQRGEILEMTYIPQERNKQDVP